MSLYTNKQYTNKTVIVDFAWSMLEACQIKTMDYYFFYWFQLSDTFFWLNFQVQEIKMWYCIV